MFSLPLTKSTAFHVTNVFWKNESKKDMWSDFILILFATLSKSISKQIASFFKTYQTTILFKKNIFKVIKLYWFQIFIKDKNINA